VHGTARHGAWLAAGLVLTTPEDAGPINGGCSAMVTNGASGSFHRDEACWSSFHSTPSTPPVHSVFLVRDVTACQPFSFPYTFLRFVRA